MAPGNAGTDRVARGPAEVVANVVEKPGTSLATLINTGENRIAAEASLKAGYVAYEPMSAELLHGKNGRIRINLDGWAHRHVVFVKKPEHSQVLFGLGAQKLELETWDERRRRLDFLFSALAGAPLQITLYSTVLVREITNGNGQSVSFKWSRKTGLVRFDATHQAGDRFVARF